MNKLSVVVISIFLFLGFCMWYLADISYSQHIKQQITLQAEAATDHKITLQDIKLLNEHHAGTLHQLALIDKVTNTTVFSIEQIYYQFDEKSLKKDTHIIDQLIFKNISAKIDNELQQSLINKINHYIEKQQLTMAEQPQISINNIIIYHQEQPNSFTIAPLSTEKTTNIEVLFANIFKQLLIEKQHYKNLI